MSISTSVGPQPSGLVDRLASVGGFADDLDVGRRLEQLAESGADECLVVGDEDAYAHEQREPRADFKAAAVARRRRSSRPP